VRAQNIVDAAAKMNSMFEADALDPLRAPFVAETPDIAVAAQEWIGAFEKAAMLANLGDHIAANPRFCGNVIPDL